jgi:hypothetical protein
MPAKPVTEPAVTGIYRRVRLDSAGFVRRVSTADGAVVEAQEFGSFGQEIGPLSPQEIMRLESLGALAEPGATFEDCVAEREQRQEAYRVARRTVPETA